MIRRIVICTIILATSILKVGAQETKTGDFFGYIPSMKVSVISPMALLDMRAFAEVSFEHKVSPRNSIEYSAGLYLPYSGWHSETNGRTYDGQNSGFRLRANYKLYFSQYDFCKDKNSYVAPELLFHSINAHSTGWFDRFDNAYQEYMTVKRKITAIGAGVIFGEQVYMPKMHHLFLDLYAGIGCRSVNITEHDLPEDLDVAAHRGAFGFIARQPGRYFHPYFIFGFKMGFVLKK